MKGPAAVLNFPEMAAALPRPASAAPRDVQAAAARAAAMEPAQPPDGPPAAAAAAAVSLQPAPVPAVGQQQDDELEAIVELPRLDEDYCAEAELVTTTVTAFGAAPFSFHDAATPAPWCDPVWIDDDCAGYAAAGHDDLFGLDGGDHGWAQSVGAWPPVELVIAGRPV